jgi:hypothetical protein
VLIVLHHDWNIILFAERTTAGIIKKNNVPIVMEHDEHDKLITNSRTNGTSG